MTNNLGNTLAVTGDRGLCSGHGLQVDAPQSFVAARQGKQQCLSHSGGNLGAVLPSSKENFFTKTQFRSQSAEAHTFWTIPDDSPVQVGEAHVHVGEGSHE